MVDIEPKTTAPKEQNSTLKTGVEFSQKDQELDETTLNSRMELANNAVEAQTRIESQTLAQNTIKENEQKETETLEQKTNVEMKSLEQRTKAETKTLQQGVENQNTPISLSNKEIEKIVDNKTLKLVASERIKKCENLLDWLKWNRKSKRELKDKVKRAIDDMNVMVEDGYVYETKQNEYKNRLGKIIFDYYSNREPARQLIMMWQRVPVINWSADTKAEARKDRRRAKNNSEHQIDMSELKKNTALYTMIWASAAEWWDYCDFISQWWVATWHPLYIQYTEWFNNVRLYNPDIYRAITPKWQITYNTYCQRDPARYEAYCRNNNIVCTPQSYNRRFWNRFANMMEQIFPERMNRDPRQRQAWSNIWSLLAIWWTIFMWFKALQSLKKDKDWNRNWWGFAWWAAWTLALLNADTVISTIQDAFNWHPAEKSRMVSEAFRKYGFPDETARNMVDRYIWAPVTTMSALHFIPIYELESQHILEDKNGEFEFNYANYEKYINQLHRTNDQKRQVLKAWKKLDEDKCAWAWLKAFWIATREKLRSLFWSDKNKTLADTDEVKNWWENLERRVTCWVNAELYKNWLRIKDPEKVDAIMKEYEEKKDNTKMNELILEWMKGGLLEFNDNREYTLNEMLENNDIDLENMTMRWFKYSEWANEVKFSTYKELFEVVYVTDWIKRNFKWRTTAKDESPFHINTWWQLDFNDTEWYELHRQDATVVSLKEFKNMPTIKNNRDVKDAYVDYLNDRRIKSLWK